MNAPVSPIDRPAHRVPPWVALVFVGGVVLLGVAARWWVGVRSAGTTPARRAASERVVRADYVGASQCRACHPGEAAAHSGSGHARTLRPVARSPVARRLDGLVVPDPENRDVTWSYTFRDGTLAVERREAGEAGRLVLDYAFGSGHHATTFGALTSREPERPAMIEHRMTVFAHKATPDLTPGQAADGHPEGMEPFGRRHSSPNTIKCFECHATLTSDRGQEALDEATMIPNVDCERCHGPGRTHLEAARRGARGDALAMPFGHGQESAAEEVRMCGACHRLPEMGDPAIIRPDNPVLARFQPVGLMKSACYQRSGGTLSCGTCHDPHARASTDTAAYEHACLNCHQGPSRTPCKVSPTSGCIGCHMPRRDVSRGMMMTDHWISSRPPSTAGLGKGDILIGGRQLKDPGTTQGYNPIRGRR